MDELKKNYQIAVFITLVMIGSLFVYAVLVEIIKRIETFKGIFPDSEHEIIRLFFFGAVVLAWLAIRWVRKVILSRKRAMEHSPTEGRPFSSRAQNLFSSTIITSALCEAIGLLGLVFFFIGGSSLDFYLFLVISLVSFVIHFPRYSRWEEYVRAS